jgi:hypothetical protein
LAVVSIFWTTCPVIKRLSDRNSPNASPPAI